MKVGKYTGNVYSDDDVIEECCFNIEGCTRPEEDVLRINKNECIKCALLHNFSSECMPCKELAKSNEETQYNDPLEVLKELRSKKALPALYDQYENYINILNSHVFDCNGYKLVVIKKD